MELRKICSNDILRGQLQENLAPFEKFWSVGKDEVKPGEGTMKTGPEMSPANYIFWINLVQMHSNL